MKHISLSFCAFLTLTTPLKPLLADTICHRGSAEDIAITLTLPDSRDEVGLVVNRTYFNGPQFPRDGSHHKNLGLRLQIPDFSPWPQSLRPHPIDGPILMFGLANARPFDTMIEYGVTMNFGYTFDDTVTWQETPHRSGLQQVSAPIKSQNALVGRFAYFLNRNASGEITDVVKCDAASRKEHPWCRHYIEQGSDDIALQYSPEHLKDWQRLSEGARAFWACLQK